ncbi:hypothetical protein AT6N2_C2294 [Agrobacterium tumefaciens]|nr:hypothetical protein AT6N2_C2294 [Agrobacterium tumefaciens]
MPVQHADGCHEYSFGKSALSLIEHDGVTGGFFRWIVENMPLSNRHEKAIAGFQPVNVSAARHFQHTFEKPDILRHPPARRMRREADARAGRKFDFDDIDIGSHTRRGNGAAHITGLRIFPELLITLFHERGNSLFIFSEETGKRQAKGCADAGQQRGRRARLTALDAGDHGAADAGFGRETVQRQAVFSP